MAVFLTTFTLFQPLGQVENIELPAPVASSKWVEEVKVGMQVAYDAGRLLYTIQHDGTYLDIEKKGDNSPVTIADNKANQLICHALINKFPTYGLLTEEKIEGGLLDEAQKNWFDKEHVWMIDPLDGTQDFIDHGTEYGVHIGLTENGEPVIGVNYYPETDTFYFAVKGGGAFKKVGNKAPELIRVPAGPVTRIVPLRNTSAKDTVKNYQRFFEETIVHEKILAVNGCGLRLSCIAEGKANLYISNGVRSGLWDYCSGEVILHEAGGKLTTLKGTPVDYREKTGRTVGGTIATNNAELHDIVLKK